MEKANIEFDDFFAGVNDEYKDFVNTVKERVLNEGYTKIKMGSSKTYIFTVAFIHPKTRRGIVNFYLRKRGMKIIISAKNCGKYPQDILGHLPENMVKQLDKAQPCQNITEPGKCMDKCIGYEFNIGDNLYQKCRFGSFRFNVDAESIPFFIELLEAELKERAAAS